MTGGLTPDLAEAEEGAVTADPNSEPIVDKIKEDLLLMEQEEVEHILNDEEKRYLLYVERGDVASVKHIIKKGTKDNTRKEGSFNLNCLDPVGRTALHIAIENENLEMMELLLGKGVDAADGLLHAIAEEYVEGVEMLLEHEEKVHIPGDPYSWETTMGERATFTPDMTPLTLAAHKDNYEILKLLLDRGAILPMPHDVKCACDECLESSAEDSLRHSLSRINSYRALSSPSLISLSSKNPFTTIFTLSEDLRKLSRLENEFTEDYTGLRQQVQNFSTALIDETRTTSELEIVLNYDNEGEPYKKGEFMHLNLLKAGVGSNQKKFVAHANVQQLLGRVWYDGMPGFIRRGPFQQLLKCLKICGMFPIYCLAFLFAPHSKFGAALKRPFVKFLVHSASYLFFLALLVIVSLRLETLVIELFGTDSMIEVLRLHQRQSRGGWPSFTELLIVIYIMGFVWREVSTLWEEGILVYMRDLWNYVELVGNFFYMNWIFLRATALFLTQRAVWSGTDPYYPREMWPPFDPLLVSEAMFCAGNILSFLKLIHMFSINNHMGPLKIALGRMVVDIIKFFFIYTLVLFAFGCGLNQLLWYYADIDKAKCYSLPGGEVNPDEERSCSIWRRFSNLFETSQTLYWASFGLVDLSNFDLTGIKSFTRFWSMLIYGSYNVINVIVLLNLLIAMMSNSYTFIVEKCDVEWKFARAKLWMSYFEIGNEVPPPFNLLPNFHVLFAKKETARASFKKKNDSLRDTQYQSVTRNLVRRYVTQQQRKQVDTEINEDDVNEVKHDIGTFKHELLNILKINGMKTGDKHCQENNAISRRQQMHERRIMKGFNIGIVEGVDTKDIMAALVFTATEAKKSNIDWNKSVRRGMKSPDPIGSSTTSIARSKLRQSVREKSPAWNAVKFYQRRGVFAGGEINSRMLKEVRVRDTPKHAVQSKCKGWRALKVMHQKGVLRQDSSIENDNMSTAPVSPPVMEVEEATTSTVPTSPPKSSETLTSETSIKEQKPNSLQPKDIKGSNEAESKGGPSGTQQKGAGWI